MRLKNVPGARETIDASAFTIPEPEVWKGRWQEVFGRQAPLHIEIGMGKGQFLTALAAEHPDINYIGIEKFSSVLVRAVQKQNELELPNLRLIRMDADSITDVFASGEVDRDVYKRQLTSRTVTRLNSVDGGTDRSLHRINLRELLHNGLISCLEASIFQRAGASLTSMLNLLYFLSVRNVVGILTAQSELSPVSYTHL